MRYSLLLLAAIVALAHWRRAASLTPPSFINEPPRTVWFQPSDALTGRQNNFELPCVASGDVENYKWRKDGQAFVVDGTHVLWSKSGQTGSLLFRNPTASDQGYYQCHAANAFGTAVSNQVRVRLGFLDHFPDRDMRVIRTAEGKSVSIECKPPRGVPPPTVSWVVRDLNVESVLESVNEQQSERVAVDEQGTLHFSYVLRNDTQTTRFFECAVSSPVLRGEYRGGDRIQLNVAPKAPIPYTDPYILYRSPEAITVRTGETLRLSCILSGYPPTTPVWSKANENLPTSRMPSDSASNGMRFLIIDPVHPVDAGTYYCEFYGERIQYDVTVKAAPYWETNSPADLSESEEEDAELRCEAGGSPRPLIRWLMNGVPLHELPDNDRRMVLDDGRILRITNIRRDVDTAVYQCNASSPIDYVYANAYINVLAMAPKFKTPEKKIWKVARYETIDMPCVVEAAPKPTVRWVDSYDQPVQLVDEKLEITADNTLRIHHVDHTDERVYFCNVTNKYGINRAENTLLVYDQLIFRQVPLPSHVEVSAYESVELRCEAQADPRLKIDYLWLRNNEPFEFFPVLENSTSVLRLDSVRGKDSGRITCKAMTEIGQKKAEMQLTVRDVPEPPSHVHVVCHPRSALISWRSPLAHGSPISEYRVQLQTNWDENAWHTALVERNLEDNKFEAHVNLSPWTRYTIRILAKNSFGESSPGSDESARCETPPNVPFANPANVRVAGTKPDNLVIRWMPLEKSQWNAPGLKYRVQYRRRGSSEPWTEFYVEDPQADHTTLRERPTFKEYEVRVRAVNDKGQSTEAPDVVGGYSGEDVPLEAPAHLMLANVDDYDRVTLQWESVKPETVRGHFRGYRVIYWITDNAYFTESLLVGPQHLKAELAGLKALTSYTAEVRVVNEAYESPSGLSITFTTPEGRPSAVTNLVVTAVGAESVLAVWDEPSTPNGFIRGYYVEFINSSAPGQIGESYVLATQRHYLSEQLKPDSAYVFQVWAETKGGEGEKQSAPFRTFPLRDPDVPRFGVHSHSPSSLHIKWQRPDSHAYTMPGTTFFVRYAIVGSDKWNETSEIALPKREFLLEGLQPDVDYWIVGVARENERSAHSARYKVHTGGGIGLSYLNAENLRDAAWFIAILGVVGIILIVLATFCCIAQCRSNGKYSVQKRERQFGKNNDQSEYSKFLEYYAANERDDPPTISVSLADSTIEKRLERIEADRKADSPPHIHHKETVSLIPKK